MANLCCSVEMEPQTLKRGQMHHAREVAVGIFQKMEQVEASNVLIIHGEEQVISMEMDQIVESIDEELCQTNENTVLGKSRQCSCTHQSNDEPLDYDGHDLIREPHTAPF